MVVRMMADEREKVRFVTNRTYKKMEAAGGAAQNTEIQMELPPPALRQSEWTFRHTEKNKSKQTASARGLGLGGVGDN